MVDTTAHTVGSTAGHTTVPPAGPRLFDPERAVQELMPDGFDWQQLVRDYPVVSLLLAGFGGYLLGRKRGVQVVEDLSLFAAGQVVQGVNQFLGEEVL